MIIKPGSTTPSGAATPDSHALQHPPSPNMGLPYSPGAPMMFVQGAPQVPPQATPLRGTDQSMGFSYSAGGSLGMTASSGSASSSMALSSLGAGRSIDSRSLSARALDLVPPPGANVSLFSNNMRGATGGNTPAGSRSSVAGAPIMLSGNALASRLISRVPPPGGAPATVAGARLIQQHPTAEASSSAPTSAHNSQPSTPISASAPPLPSPVANANLQQQPPTLAGTTDSVNSGANSRTATPVPNPPVPQGTKLRDPNDKGPKQLIVKFLAPQVTETELRALFQQYGPVEYSRMIYDSGSGGSKGYGFIYYYRSADAAAAVSAMDGFELYGRFLRVGFAIPQRQPPAPPPLPGQASGPSSQNSSPSSSQTKMEVDTETNPIPVELLNFPAQ